MVTHRQRYREKVSQMVSWGHWFALFNILLSLVIGSRYLFIADWPTTLAGRIYSYVSIIGHFSFLVFATYLLILFPLTFIVGSQRLMRFLSVILATAGMTLLLIDSESLLVSISILIPSSGNWLSTQTKMRWRATGS